LAAAAVVALALVRDEDLAEKANRTAAELRAALRQVLIEESVPWGIYGQSSTFVIYLNPTGEDLDPATFDPLKLGFAKLKGARSGPLIGKIRMGLMSHGATSWAARVDSSRQRMAAPRSRRRRTRCARPCGRSRRNAR
jgi:glutamate-1-semialdehyde 2,1-aminomutase